MEMKVSAWLEYSAFKMEGKFQKENASSENGDDVSEESKGTTQEQELRKSEIFRQKLHRSTKL